MTTATTEQFAGYQAAFDYFNATLFGGELPPCILNFSRHANSYGFFVPDTWQREGVKAIPEISLNPDHLGGRDLRATLSTLVHEMSHHWQEAFGKPSKGGYHNKEWAAKMKSLGLHPSSTGEPGGKELGTKVSHYILENGSYDIAFRDMPREIGLPWCTVPRLEGARAKAKRKSKTPYICGGCATKVWAKPGLTMLHCEDCDEPFEEIATQ